MGTMNRITSHAFACLLALSPCVSGCDDGGAAGGGTGDGGSGGSGLVGAEATQMTSEHNRVRHQVSPAPSVPIPDVTWSTDIAATAQAWANRCRFEHSSNAYGENIYATAGAAAFPSDVVGSWASEASAYDYTSDTCSDVCEHYTQIVWRDTQRIGCAKATCTRNSPFVGFPTWEFWVCNYDPAGNFVGQRPY